MSSNIFEIGKTYSFEVYPTSIIGNNYTNCTCMGVFTYRDAVRHTDVAAEHHKVYPYLPAGTPDSPTLYNYAKFELRDGSTTILGLTWINVDTIKIVDTQTITVKIKNVSANKVSEIRDILNANGIEDFSITPSEL